MIPKRIHYCWFGPKTIPRSARRCIESWRRHLSGYEFRIWDESAFDVNSIRYVREAYRARKYAFVSDYVRLYAVSQCGGIYLDTDVEVIRSFDELLTCPAFAGFESEDAVGTGIIGSERGGAWATEQLDAYRDRRFFLADGSYDLATNVATITRAMAAKGLRLDNSFQVYENCLHIFPTEYFCPKAHTGFTKITANTYCIHHFAGSWESPKVKAKMFLIRKVLGPEMTQRLIRLKRSLKARVAQFRGLA